MELKLHIYSIEGLDAGGKGTQTGLLADRLRTAGFKVQILDFPRYDTFIGNEIGERLSGKAEMDATQLPTKDMSLWYAMDRMLAFESIKHDTQIILMNRSTYSNVGYQLARLPKAEQPVLKDWLLDLEFNVLNIPKPNKVFFLDIPVAVSQQLVSKKGTRNYIGDKADVYEKDDTILHNAREVYQELLETEDNFERIECVDANGQLKSITTISDMIFDRTLASLPQAK